MDLTPDEMSAIAAMRTQALPPPPKLDEPQSVRIKLHLVEHEIGQAAEHEAAVNVVLATVDAPRGLLRRLEVELIPTDGTTRLVTQIWVGEPIGRRET